MKKITAVVLALLLALVLVACSGETEEKGNKSDKTDKKEQVDKKEKDDAENGDTTFEELLVVDNEECSIKITGIDSEDMWGYALKVELVNKSSEKNYMFSVDNAAVNGVQSTPLFASEVAAGKTDNNTINFMEDSVLKENGVGEFTDIELTFEVSDSEDWEAEPVAVETVHVYPYGEDAAVSFERKSQDSDKVLVDNKDVEVIVTGYEMDEVWGYTVNLFLVNKTGEKLMFSADNTSVNGQMEECLFATEVSGEKCAFAKMTWMGESFEELGIESTDDVENIEFEMRIYDSEDWLADALFEDVITWNP